jgi:hypothetical protein
MTAKTTQFCGLIQEQCELEIEPIFLERERTAAD